MADILEKLPPALKSLWSLENELRSALQNTVLMRRDEASRHMDEAKRHFNDALTAIRRAPPEAEAEVSTPTQADQHLAYGEGQREQYGEGHKYRKEELTPGADQSTSHGWAGGEHDATPDGQTAEPNKESAKPGTE